MNAYLGKYTYVFLSILELPAYLGSTYLASMNPPNIYQALLYLIMINVKKIIFFKSIIFYALLESC